MLTGVILAGGNNQIMNGAVKAFLPMQGEMIIERQIREMRQICSEIIVVTDEPKLFLPKLDRSIRIITDYASGRGPLGAMYAAFMLAKQKDVWVTGSHMPFVSAKAGQLLLERRRFFSYDAVIPVVSGEPKPFHAVFHQSCAQVIETLLQAGDDRLSELLRKIAWGEMSEAFFKDQQLDPRFTFAIRTEADYEAALHMAEAIAGTNGKQHVQDKTG